MLEWDDALWAAGGPDPMRTFKYTDAEECSKTQPGLLIRMHLGMMFMQLLINLLLLIDPASHNPWLPSDYLPQLSICCC
jgi:hypothetical protein